MLVSSKQDRSAKAPRVSWTPDLIASVEAMLNSHTLLEIAEETGLTYRQVDSLLYSKGLYAKRKFRGERRQIEMWRFSPADLAYFAGIVDGEGTITVQRTKVKGSTYLRPHIIISTTSIELVDWLETRTLYGTLQRNQNGRGYWRATTSGWHLDSLLLAILPFLVIKKPHADALLRLIALRKQSAKAFTISGEMEALYQEIKRLNIRGSRMFEEYEKLHRERSSISSRPATASSPTA